ncbi:unnamed protein product [Caenorhabditis sp. 36 PRJEB53466]|nr:unnamed protein product [Caenorhabditis sp. 36 PRJEB53466]
MFGHGLLNNPARPAMSRTRRFQRNGFYPGNNFYPRYPGWRYPYQRGYNYGRGYGGWNGGYRPYYDSRGQPSDDHRQSNEHNRPTNENRTGNSQTNPGQNANARNPTQNPGQRVDRNGRPSLINSISHFLLGIMMLALLPGATALQICGFGEAGNVFVPPTPINCNFQTTPALKECAVRVFALRNHATTMEANKCFKYQVEGGIFSLESYIFVPSVFEC